MSIVCTKLSLPSCPAPSREPGSEAMACHADLADFPCFLFRQSSASTDEETSKMHASISIGCTALGVTSAVIGVAIIIGIVVTAIVNAS